MYCGVGKMEEFDLDAFDTNPCIEKCNGSRKSDLLLIVILFALQLPLNAKKPER